jgi:arylsulfatase I/J
MDGLVADGIELQRHYVFSCCSPSRASVLSGRLPPHVETWLTDPSISNPADTESGWAGIPRSMTGIAKMLQQANYSSYAIGKWDAGMATPQHIPRGRGFSNSLVYFHHENDYFPRRQGGCTVNTSDPDRPTEHLPCVDLWADDAPAHALNASSGDTYEEYIFKAEALRVIESHAAASNTNAELPHPLFLFYAAHVAHQPYEVPESYNQSFAFIPDGQRRAYHAMVKLLDDALEEIIRALQAHHFWNDLLMVMSTDNGGPIFAGANNFPLRGGKYR